MMVMNSAVNIFVNQLVVFNAFNGCQQTVAQNHNRDQKAGRNNDSQRKQEYAHLASVQVQKCQA